MQTGEKKPINNYEIYENYESCKKFESRLPMDIRDRY
jgi:hypothetical protein